MVDIDCSCLLCYLSCLCKQPIKARGDVSLPSIVSFENACRPIKCAHEGEDDLNIASSSSKCEMMNDKYSNEFGSIFPQ